MVWAQESIRPRMLQQAFTTIKKHHYWTCDDRLGNEPSMKHDKKEVLACIHDEVVIIKISHSAYIYILGLLVMLWIEFFKIEPIDGIFEASPIGLY